MASDARRKAEATLPPESRAAFDALIRDYEAACATHVKGGHVFRNYNIFADLIRNGWRKSEPSADQGELGA